MWEHHFLLPSPYTEPDKGIKEFYKEIQGKFQEENPKILQGFSFVSYAMKELYDRFSYVSGAADDYAEGADYFHGRTRIDETSAGQAVASVLRFLARMGVIRYTSHKRYISTVVREDDIINVRTGAAGIYRRKREPGEEVRCGDVLAEILDPGEGGVLS